MSTKKHQSQTFRKLILGYFISISLFLFLSGFLYFKLQQQHVLQTTAMQMYKYFIALQKTGFTYKQKEFDYSIGFCDKIDEKLPLFNPEKNYYQKTYSDIYTIIVAKQYVQRQIDQIMYQIISILVFLHILFGFLSYWLAKVSIAPMIETISHLDRFIADLIHDLNTPLAAISINHKLITKKDKEGIMQAECQRIDNSISYIKSLYENLQTIQKDTLPKENFKIKELVIDLIERYKTLYPNIQFSFDIKEEEVYSHSYAIERIVDNIISNSCKYATSKNPMIEIKYNKHILSIKDNGKGMKYPNKIFERHYQEENLAAGYGIGMHIVYRLCSTLGHKITIQSEVNQGTFVKIQLV